MQAHYLEIVTKDVDGVCSTYAAVHRVNFGDPDPVLGHARTATLAHGSTIGVRAPMHDEEEETMRPYWIVEDLDAAVQIVEESGGEIALRSMEIKGRGRIAIYFQGAVEHGLWQL